MRTRTNQGPFCESLECLEYQWDKSNPSAYKCSMVERPVGSTYTRETWTVPSSYRQFDETITDDTGEDGRFRSCLHTYETNEFDNPLVTYHTANCSQTEQPCCSVLATSISQLLAKRTPPTIDMAVEADKAVKVMLPKVNEGTSLVNFIIELKDLKRMNPVPSVKRIFRPDPRKLKSWLEAPTNRAKSWKALRAIRKREMTLREVAKRLTGAHLNAEFGIVPLVRDIVEATDQLLDLKRKLGLLKRFANTQQVRHYKRVLPDSSGNPVTTYWDRSVPRFAFDGPDWDTSNWFVNPAILDNPGGGNRGLIYQRWCSRWIQRPVYRATMRYNYSLPDRMTEAEEMANVRLDALGVRLDPSIVWNALPWSFLVDWVIDVSGFLGTFTRDNFPIQTRLTDFCHSVAWHAEFEYYAMANQAVKMTPQPNPYPVSVVPRWYTGRVYRGTRKHYNREVYTPSIATLGAIKAPTGRKAALSGSLLIQKGLQRK